MMRWLGFVVVAVLTLASVQAYAQWTWTPQTGRFVNLKKMPKETPMLQIEYARSLMLEGDYKRAITETDKFSDFYPDTDDADANQFLRGEIRQAQGSLQDAADAFQQVVVNYPDTELYDAVITRQHSVGDLLYDRGVAKQQRRWAFFPNRPFRRASDVYAMVIDNQPFTEAAAEAQLKVGLCHFTLEEYIEAAFEYRRILEDYAASEWVDEAAYGLAMCHYEASPPPEYDQAPSQLTINAIDDFASRFPADARNGELTPKRNEMRERIAQQRLQTARFYERRRAFASAAIAYRVVVDQYGDTPAAADARTWLAANPVEGKRQPYMAGN